MTRVCWWLDKEASEYFELVANGRDGKLAANWVVSNLYSLLNRKGLQIAQSPISAENLGKLIDLISDNTISGRIAKDVFEFMEASDEDPEIIVEQKGLRQITDSNEIETAVDKVIAENPGQVAQFQEGNQKIAGWFVGQVHESDPGKGQPKTRLVNF